MTSLASGTPSEQSNEYSATNSESSNSSRDMLDEIEETFNITNPSSINTSFRPTSQDFLSSLTSLSNLTLNNIADDSSSDENDDEIDDEEDNNARFEDNGNFTKNTDLRK